MDGAGGRHLQVTPLLHRAGRATGRTDEELYRAMAAKVRTSSPLPEPSATPATPTRLMDDLRNGIALAKLATKLNKSIT